MLNARCEKALGLALTFCQERTQPLGVVATGSLVRGEGDANSDLDIYVIHQNPWRQRIQKFFAGVPCEIFINAPTHIRGYFEEDNRSGRPITAHMLTTGTVLLGQNNPLVQTLIQEAKNWLATPPKTSAESLQQQRYLIACGFEDAFDVVARDAATASLILGQVIPAALAFAFVSNGHHVPRPKDLMRILAQFNPALHQATQQYTEAPSLALRVAAAQTVADLTLNARGFFEWETALPE